MDNKNNYYIPNAVDSNFSNTYNKNDYEFFLNNYNLDLSSKKYVGFIGRLSTIKGFDLFLKIVDKVNQKIPNVPILIIGEGNLEYLLSEYNHLNIKYIKKISYTKISNIYKIQILSNYRLDYRND